MHRDGAREPNGGCYFEWGLTWPPGFGVGGHGRAAYGAKPTTLSLPSTSGAAALQCACAHGFEMGLSTTGSLFEGGVTTCRWARAFGSAPTVNTSAAAE